VVQTYNPIYSGGWPPWKTQGDYVRCLRSTWKNWAFRGKSDLWNLFPVLGPGWAFVQRTPGKQLVVGDWGRTTRQEAFGIDSPWTLDSKLVLLSTGSEGKEVVLGANWDCFPVFSWWRKVLWDILTFPQSTIRYRLEGLSLSFLPRKYFSQVRA
jgi:hypothetical protein